MRFATSQFGEINFGEFVILHNQFNLSGASVSTSFTYGTPYVKSIWFSSLRSDGLIDMLSPAPVYSLETRQCVDALS